MNNYLPTALDSPEQWGVCLTDVFFFENFKATHILLEQSPSMSEELF